MRFGDLAYAHIEEKQHTESVFRLCIADPVQRGSDSPLCSGSSCSLAGLFRGTTFGLALVFF